MRNGERPPWPVSQRGQNPQLVFLSRPLLCRATQSWPIFKHRISLLLRKAMESPSITVRGRTNVFQDIPGVSTKQTQEQPKVVRL